ncbi:MAG: hypothetical protein ACFFFH_06440 [Candidatus Thorarchaeota archaeon]
MSNFFNRVIFCCSILTILLFLTINSSRISGVISEVEPNDTWNYTVDKAYMAFVYSSGFLNFRSSTQGYRLENTLVPIQEEITVTIITYETTPQTTIIYQVSWENTTVVVNSSTLLTENGLQESLGHGIIGSGYDFLFSDTGVTIGDWVFIVPVDTLLSSLQVWNKSTLPGAIEGMETILDLGDEENEKDYHMWIKYEGTMENDSFGLNLQFFFNADFRWEKRTGVLLAYEIITSMQGEYQSQDATFNLELKLERTDLDEFIGQNVSSFDLFILTAGLLVLVYSRAHLRKYI